MTETRTSGALIPRLSDTMLDALERVPLAEGETIPSSRLRDVTLNTLVALERRNLITTDELRFGEYAVALTDKGAVVRMYAVEHRIGQHVAMAALAELELGGFGPNLNRVLEQAGRRNPTREEASPL